jgi:hypothetical protein
MVTMQPMACQAWPAFGSNMGWVGRSSLEFRPQGVAKTGLALSSSLRSAVVSARQWASTRGAVGLLAGACLVPTSNGIVAHAWLFGPAAMAMLGPAARPRLLFVATGGTSVNPFLHKSKHLFLVSIPSWPLAWWLWCCGWFARRGCFL